MAGGNTLNFEWDSIKAKSNLRKHDISFEEAATIFNDPNMLTIYDEENSLYEDRCITLGISNTRKIILVVHTYKTETKPETIIRIISARKATKGEERQYKEI